VVPGTTIVGAGVLLAAVVVAAVWLGRPGPDDGVGAVTSPRPSATPIATAMPSVSPNPTAAPTATAAPTVTPTPVPTAAPTVGACDPARLVARITEWGGAAGNRIATVELTNAGTHECTLHTMGTPQLVDGTGTVLIDGATPPASKRITLAPGAVLTTAVSASNYCGPAPTPAVSVAFVMGGAGRIVAAPVSPTDITVPPCNGAGSAASISMHPWAP
jgi:hypothetical protein